MEVLKSEQNIINLNDHINYDISIKHIDLSKNNIAYIPDEFGNLLNLKVIFHNFQIFSKNSERSCEKYFFMMVKSFF